MAAAVTPTAYNVTPSQGYSIYQISYTKGAQNDTIDVASYTPLTSILYVWASDDTAGALDEVTWSGTTITFTGAETGAGTALVIGSCSV